MSSISWFSNNTIIPQLVSKAIVLFCCFPVHECSHAWMAARLGDHTAEREGRITLNPFKHLNLWGTIMLVVFGMGYAKPVPVNTCNLRKPKTDYAIVSLAGPISNLIMGLAFLLIENAIYCLTGVGNETVWVFILYCMRYAAYINFSLAIFNLIPVPPLDGYHALLALVPNKVYNKAVRLERYSVYALLGLLLILSIFRVSPITAAAQNLFNTADGLCELLFHK